MIKAVFDTNIYISAIGFDGKPETLLRLAHHREFLLYITPTIVAEVSSVLVRKFHQSNIMIKKSLIMINFIATQIFPKETVSIITVDPTDNIILECALACNADYIVTGDTKHILPLQKFHNAKIVTANEFLEILKQNWVI